MCDKLSNYSKSPPACQAYSDFAGMADFSTYLYRGKFSH